MTQYNNMDRGFILGNSIDIKLTGEDIAEIRADVVVATSGVDSKCNVIRLWGQIKDCNGTPIPNALLKLIKVICTHTSEYYEGIAHTVSDCNGFYQFDLCYCDGNECYKVLVNKAYTGAEQIIETNTGICSACVSGENSYNLCKPFEPIVTPHVPHCQKPTPYPTPWPAPCQQPCDCYE